MCSPNLLEIIILFTIISKASTEGVNGKESILFELPLSNIRVGGGDIFRLKEAEEVVKVVGEVLKWPSSKLGRLNHYSTKEASLGTHCGMSP